MKKVVKDILSLEKTGEKVAKIVVGTCPICGSEIYYIDGESFSMCDCDKMRPAEMSGV